MLNELISVEKIGNHTQLSSGGHGMTKGLCIHDVRMAENQLLKKKDSGQIH